ncbi:MAG: glycosyltransferase [Hyphomicrobiales bacterium]
MPDLATVVAAVSVIAWIVLLGFRRGFWRADQRLETGLAEPRHWPQVAALVPARNEAEHIEACLAALGGQDYPGGFAVLVVNDASTDETADIARRAARNPDIGRAVEVVDAPPLEAGWAGKLWALDHGIDHLKQRAVAPDYLWLSDADVVHEPATLRRLVAKAEAQDLALVSLMVRLACRSFWERLLVPAFVFFFQMLYPFPAINDRNSSMAGAAGGCMLLRWCVLDRTGGIAAIKDQLIDDCALGARIKQSGNGIWIGLGDESHSLRRYAELARFWQMVARSAFVQLRFSTILLIVSILGMAVTFVFAPLILLAVPWHGSVLAAVLAAISWTLMCVAYIPTVRYYGLEAWRSLTLPVASVLYMMMTLHSGIRHWCGLGQSWKNRAYRPK